VRVTVKLFGPQARLAGSDAIAAEFAGAPSCAQIRSHLAELVPALAPTLAHSRLAVNHEFAADDQIVAAGDEIALIGMVSGGLESHCHMEAQP
jgi:molybdopterin converting factor small subunit